MLPFSIRQAGRSGLGLLLNAPVWSTTLRIPKLLARILLNTSRFSATAPSIMTAGSPARFTGQCGNAPLAHLSKTTVFRGRRLTDIIIGPPAVQQFALIIHELS